MKFPLSFALHAICYSGAYMILGTVYFALLDSYRSLGQSSFYMTLSGLFFPAIIVRPSSVSSGVEGSLIGLVLGTALYGGILFFVFLAVRHFRIRDDLK